MITSSQAMQRAVALHPPLRPPAALAPRSAHHGLPATASTNCRLAGAASARAHALCGEGRRAHVRAAASSVIIPAEFVDASSHDEHEEQGSGFSLVCPICQQQPFALPGMPTRAEGLSCPRCSRTFDASPQYVDLTLNSGLKPKVYSQKAWGGTELFRNPLISFVYERGWRQGFAWAGFPGVEKEYDMAMRYLEPVGRGKVLVDMSCGSGLFTRRFARSGRFSAVVAADYSESMLQQARTYFEEDGTMPRAPAPGASSGAARSASGGAASTSAGSGGTAGASPILLLRADVARLPFATGSVAALHAGAAIHCWPNPQAALAEISRVLAPGGVFVASTFMVAAAPLGEVLGDSLVRPLNQLDSTAVRSQYRWWEEEELRDLCSSVGLQGFSRDRQWRFIMFSARKP